LNIKFCLQLWKAIAETYEMIETVPHVSLDGLKGSVILRTLKMISGAGSVSCFKCGNSCKNSWTGAQRMLNYPKFDRGSALCIDGKV
jgi:hypothetical protein